jgi:hypothetical protein
MSQSGQQMVVIGSGQQQTVILGFVATPTFVLPFQNSIYRLFHLLNFIIMRHTINLLISAVFTLFATHAFGQFRDALDGEVLNNDITSIMYRTGRVGIGFANYNAYNSIVGANPPRLLVQGGILGHYVSGTVGSFGSTSKWLGLGIGNPGNNPEPYGLAILDSTNLGFYNIIAESGRKNVIAGFGVNGTTNKNRFIIRGYSGTNGTTGKDLLVANPEGGVGINAEPLSSLWVDSRFSNPDSLFRAIAILSRQPLFSASSVETASAIGTQANNSLIQDEIAVEGFRAQIPDFISVLQNPEGVAVNLQTVNNPRGDANTPTVTDVVAFGNTEYAELTWQDIDSDDNVYVSCDSFPIDSAEIRDKFFISFRSGENVKPFVAGNKLPVMTFQANGRVGNEQIVG